MKHAGDLILLGIFLKTHGVNGHLILKLFDLSDRELNEGEPVFIEIDGIPVPFFVSHFRFLTDDSAVIGLDETVSPEQASEFVNCRVFVRETLKIKQQKGESDAEDDLTGYTVTDRNYGEAGILREIIEYPENPVMVVDLKGKEILIPFHESIVKHIDHRARMIHISAPEGLFDLYI